MRRGAREGGRQDTTLLPGWGGVSRGPIGEEPRDEELCRLLDATSDGLVVVRNGAVAWANATMARIAGVAEPKDLLGRPLEEMFADTGHGVPDAELRGRRPCAVPRRGAEPMRVVVGRIEGGRTGAEMALAVQDVTTVYTLEEEVLHSGRALREANRRAATLRERLQRESEKLEELLTVVAHELRTPATVIAGYNRLLLSERVGTLNERQISFLEESQRSCQRLNTFIGNLLESAREASFVGPLEVAEAPVGPTIDAVVRMMRPLLTDHHLSMAVRVAAGTPRARFDPPRIEQVLTNLIGNAIKFAPEESCIEISAGGALFEGRSFVEVSVADPGPGVSAADRERIFEPYVRTGESRGAGGLGLGLAICKRIVEAHGGSIRIEDRPGGGSRFAFRLPAAGGPGA
jgi:signal transduction histidine kinase